MKKIKDIKIVILMLILLVFTIGYFVIANKISYAFDNSFDISSVKENKIKIITKCAEAYGAEHKDKFNEEGLIYITVQTLIDEGYLASNDSGQIVSIEDSNEILNSKKIRIKLIDNKITAEIYS